MSFFRRKKSLTGGVNFTLPQGNMRNVDNTFRKAIPNSRYLGLCCWGGEQQSLKLATGVAKQKTERSKGACWPGVARSTSGLLFSPLATGFGFAKTPGAWGQLLIYVYVTATLGHLAEGWEWVGSTLIRSTVVRFDPQGPKSHSHRNHMKCQHAHSVLHTVICFTS